MADLAKIQHYLDQIKKLHLTGIVEPADVLSKLLENYLTEKKQPLLFSKASGMLFGNNAPSRYAKQILREIKTGCDKQENFYNKINEALTRHFHYNHYKMNGGFSALWIAFLTRYHSTLPEFKENTFFKKAIITSHLVKEKKLKRDVDNFLSDISSNEYYRSFSECKSRLVSMIKICGTSWIKPVHHDIVVDTLMKLPFWEDQYLDHCHESTLIAISALETLIPKEMIQSFYTEILTNLADDIESIHYKTLLSISKIPFSNIDDARIINSLKTVIQHRYVYEEYTDEDTSEYRSCIILEILLKITKDPNIHEIIYNKISQLLESDQDNSVEILLQNISVPENYKKIYIHKLLDNLKQRRRRYDTTKALKKLIDTPEDNEKFFTILIYLIEKKHSLNSITGIINIHFSNEKQEELKKLVMRFLKGNTSYLGVEILRVVKFDPEHEQELLSLMRPLLKGNNQAGIVDAMHHLPFDEKDNIDMIMSLLGELKSEQEHYAIHLLSAIPIPRCTMKTVIEKLTSRITDDDIVASQAIRTLSILNKKMNIFIYIESNVLLQKITYKLSQPSIDSCVEKICLAIPNFSFSSSQTHKLIPSLLKLVYEGNAVMVKAAIFALTKITSSCEAKIPIILSILYRINKAANLCYHADVVSEDINTLIRFIAEHFSATEQIGICSMIERELNDNPIIADNITSRLILGIKVEKTLHNKHNLPTEMIKHVYHFV